MLILLRADNNGEGGTLSLTALASRALGRRTAFVFDRRRHRRLDVSRRRVITPAISVLSAVEGLKLATPAFSEYVAPLAVGHPVRRCSPRKAAAPPRSPPCSGRSWWSGSSSIAIAGALHIRDDPHVLLAINPLYGIDFLLTHGAIGLVTLGAVFLAVTGGEALYADLGHFGRKPIQIAWLCLVLPALLINYFGQGAKVLADPAAIENPFYRLVPELVLVPMIVLATAATVIASQAVITGAYSLVQQAIQLGLLPRLAILHTSASHDGQIYMPRVTISLLIGVLLLVGLFRTSSALASRLRHCGRDHDGGRRRCSAFIVIWKLWQWRLWQALLLIVPFVVVDVTFFSANLLKLFEGAWVPLLFGATMVLIILTWRRGTGILLNKTRRTEVPLDTLFRSLEKKPPHIVPGTAVFLTSDPDFAPTALLHNLKHNKVLHEHNVILTIVTADTPRVPEEERVQITPLSEHFSRVALKFGFWSSRTCRRRWRSRASTAGSSTSCRPRSSCRAARSSRRRSRACRAGRIVCSSCSPARPTTPPTSSRFPTGRVVEVGTQVTV